MTTANHAVVVVPERTRALHTLRVAGWLSTDRFPDATVLDNTTLFKRVTTARGDLASLTLAGEHAAEVELAAVCRHVDDAARQRITVLLGTFEQSDATMKDLVTAFQRDRCTARAEEIVVLHRRVTDLIAAIAALFPLWGGYPERLAAAVRQIEAGDTDHIASPLLDSYHTVWHLLHRDMRLVVDSW